MGTINKSTFLTKIGEVGADLQKEIENNESKRAAIVIACELDSSQTESIPIIQTGTICGSEEMLVFAMAGFVKNPQIRDILKKALIFNMVKSIAESGDKKEQEGNK